MYSFRPKLRRCRTPYPNQNDSKPEFKDTGNVTNFLGISWSWGAKSDNGTAPDTGEKQRGELNPKKGVISKLKAIVSKFSRSRPRFDDKHAVDKLLHSLGGTTSVKASTNVSRSESSAARKKVHARDITIVRVERVGVNKQSPHRRRPYPETRNNPYKASRTRPVASATSYHIPPPYPYYVPAYVRTTSTRVERYQQRKPNYAVASSVAAFGAAAAVCCC